MCWLTNEPDAAAWGAFMTRPGVRSTTIHSAGGPESPAAILTAPGRSPDVRLRDAVSDGNPFDVGRTRAPEHPVVTWGRRGAFTDRFLRSSEAVASTGEGIGRGGARRGGRSQPREAAPAWPTTVAPARMAFHDGSRHPRSQPPGPEATAVAMPAGTARTTPGPPRP